jgi:membrane-associated phospholipid phosphatase
MTGHVVWVLLIRVLLVFAVGGVFALVWLLPHLGFHWLRGPADKVLRHPLLGGLRRHAPGLVDFAKRHFIDQRRSWLRAILGVLVVLFGLAWFRSLLVLSLAGILWVASRRREAVALVIAWGGAELLGAGLKWVIERPRPLEAQALLHGYSFPSGHTLDGGTVYGFLVYLILRDERSRAWHWLAVIPCCF